jgi:hypothetical protein
MIKAAFAPSTAALRAGPQLASVNSTVEWSRIAIARFRSMAVRSTVW